MVQVMAGFWRQRPAFLLPADTDWSHCV